MSLEIEFKGKTARVRSLHQWSTYEGLLEGVPTDKLNKRILENIRSKAVELTSVPNCYLVEPTATPIDLGRKYPFGEPMSFPGIVCVAGLKAMGTSNPDVGGISELTLIYFQDAFSPPIDDNVLNELKNVDWFAHAEDISWDDY